MNTETIEAFANVVIFVPIIFVVGIGGLVAFIWWDSRVR